jgi:hypothetical protein
MPRMSSAQVLQAPVGLLPLSRPLMTGEVLDAAFRLFRAGLLRCLPYSGLAVLTLELPDIRATFFPGGAFGTGAQGRYVLEAISMLLGVALLGVLTLRLSAVSRGLRPRVRREVVAVLKRWPAAVIATVGALAFPGALVIVATMFNPVYPNFLMLLLTVALLWPTGLFVVALPAFWCDGLGPFTAIARAVRVSRRKLWRMAGAVMATACLVLVFYVLAAMAVGLLSPLMGRADLFLIATLRSMLLLVVGTLGIPFVVAMLIVAYEDLKLRDAERRGAAP